MAEARKQVTHIGGVEIIGRQAALSPHPNPNQNGRLVETTGVEHILLADGTETYMCVDCGYTNDNSRSVVAHMSGAHSLTRGPSMYSDEVLRTLVREVLRAKKTGVRNYMEVAAHALNEMGIQPVQGIAFTSQGVGSLYGQHHQRFPDVRVRVRAEDRRPVSPAPPLVQPPLPEPELEVEPPTGPEPEPIIVDTAELHGPAKAVHNNRVRRVQRMLIEMAQELEWFARQYDEIERKARAYDKMKATIQGL